MNRKIRMIATLLLTLFILISLSVTALADNDIIVDEGDFLVCPVPYESAYVASPYGERSIPGMDGSTSFHYGIDITMGGAEAYDKKIVAAAPGTVLVASNACTHNQRKASSCGCNGGYGNYCVIDHGNGVIAWYAHLTTCYVSAGQNVSRGQTIGIMGCTGYSTGAHLHFELRSSATGARSTTSLNPLTYITVPSNLACTEHSFTNFVFNNDATCTSDGTETAVCDNCLATGTRTALDTKLDHSFTNYVYNNDATCTADGTKTAVCDNEGCSETDTINAEGTMLAHITTDWIVDNEPGIGVEGLRHKECTICNNVVESEPIPASPYLVIKGNNSSCFYGETVTITANGDINDFVELKVDNELVDKANYLLKSGSTIVTFNESYLSSLSVGKHSIAFVYKNGTTEGTFYIKQQEVKPEEDDRIAYTKDDSKILSWSILMLVNGSFAIILNRQKIKEQNYA